MFSLKKIFIFFIVLILLTAPSISLAKERGLVPCDGACPAGSSDCVPCTFCHVLVLIQNFVRFAMYDFFFPLAGLLIFYGGILMVLGEKKYAEGKSIVKNTIIGLVIILTSFVIVNTIILIIAPEDSDGFRPQSWGTIQCN